MLARLSNFFKCLLSHCIFFSMFIAYLYTETYAALMFGFLQHSYEHVLKMHV